MSDSKELSVLRTACQRLSDSDDRTIGQFCHSAADVSALEDALQQCSTEHFQAQAAAASLSAAPDQETVQETMRYLLWWLLTDVLTRNRRANAFNHLSWSLDGYSMVARIAKSILSSWCIDEDWIDDVDSEEGDTVFMRAAQQGHTSVVELLLADPRVDKVSIDHADSANGDTVLMHAAKQGHTSIAELLLADPRVDKASIDQANDRGSTALILAVSNSRISVIELLLADPRVDNASIDHANELGKTALMLAAEYGHTSAVELLLADPRVDKASIHLTDAFGYTALLYAVIQGHFPVAKLLISDRRTSWDSIVELVHNLRIKHHDDIRSTIIAELTLRQMCVIYPSANRPLWPVPAQSDADSSDAESDSGDSESESSGPADDDDDDASDSEDGIAEPELPETQSECALITSFFQSSVFDVNVLRIIREYATYSVQYQLYHY
jgi:Ankyrin repeats (3 copies)/Ankyrin repeat